MKFEVESSGAALMGNAVRSPGTALRIREAAKEQRPLEQMLAQLREIIVGPTERVSEARLDEMLDILDEFKSSNNLRIEAVTTRIESVDSMTEQLKADVSQLNTMLDSLEERLIENSKHLREVFVEAITQSHNDLEKQIQSVPEMVQTALGNLEGKMRRNLDEVSNSLSAHIAEDEETRRRDREMSLTILDQRIAQWRAEIEDMRRADLQDVASSMMDVGQRLMALRKM